MGDDDELAGIQFRVDDEDNHYVVIDSGWQPIGDLGDPQLNREVNFITAAMDESPDRFWWLSFCDADLPEGHPEERHVLLTKEQTEVFDQRVAERAG